MEYLRTRFLICGGGSSAVCAGVQAARLGLDTLIAAEGPWLGGMLTAAGVSAADGNYALQGGIWKEFRDALCRLYGGDEALNTGWVSRTMFQPRDGKNIFHAMVEEAGAACRFGCVLQRVQIRGKRIEYAEFSNAQGKSFRVEAEIFMEATEFGDFIALAGIPHRFGMECREETGETCAPAEPLRRAQDAVYTATLRPGSYNQPPPPNYSPEEFAGLLGKPDTNPADPPSEESAGTLSPERMLNYGRLPGDRFMLNWPRRGNDYYLPEKAYRDRAYREVCLEAAKERTRRFLHFINTEFREKSLVLDRDQYPTNDGFPPLPYIREALRIRGEAFLCLQDIRNPYLDPNRPYCRESVAVGDYPVDHHREKNPDPIRLDLPPIPSFSVPYGSLVTRDLENFIAGEKSISVSSLVNGTTRLQPVVMGIGQAAGAAAWLACRDGLSPVDISIPELQIHLLNAGAYILPYKDVAPGSPWFETAQFAGVRGRMRGEGRPRSWANETHFHPGRIAGGETSAFLWGENIPAPVDWAGWLRAIRREYSVSGTRKLAENLGRLAVRKTPEIGWVNRLPNLLRETASRQSPNRGVTRGDLSVLITAVEMMSRLARESYAKYTDGPWKM